MTPQQQAAIQIMVDRHQEELAEHTLECQIAVKEFMSTTTQMLLRMPEKAQELGMKYLNESMEFIHLQ